MTLAITPIGRVHHEPDETVTLVLDPVYRQGLSGLAGFGNVVVLWWADHVTRTERARLVQEAPYRDAPSQLGTFATRAPARPNPVCLSVAGLLAVEADASRVRLSHLDAREGTPVIDLKPYTPSLDRVAHPTVATWCAHWPLSVEESAVFDWASVLRT